MEIFNVAWTWLGNEIAAFGARWLVVSAILFGFGGWFGRRYLKMRRDIAEIKSKLELQLQPQSLAISINVNTDQQSAGKPYIYDPYDRTVSFGTDDGDMDIRFHDAETIMDDISHWLRRSGHQRSVSPETVKRVMSRLQHKEQIGVSDSLTGELKKSEDT